MIQVEQNTTVQHEPYETLIVVIPNKQYNVEIDITIHTVQYTQQLIKFCATYVLLYFKRLVPIKQTITLC